MVVQYKGFELEAYRGETIMGEEHIFYSIYRNSDGWELDAGYAIDGDTVRTHIQTLKKQVDNYLKSPEDYDDD